MLIVGNVLVSEELIDKCFCCDLSQCKGECCVEGDLGAPVAPDEVAELEENYPDYKKYMTEEGVAVVENGGTFVFNGDDSFETPLVESNNACAFAFFEDGIAKCAIEKCFLKKEISFRKQISCYLYPIRVSRVGDYEALNYDHWSVCKTAVENGNRLHLPVYRFLKEPLIAKYGSEWYAELEEMVSLRDENAPSL
jgi:hypothetical protein